MEAMDGEGSFKEAGGPYGMGLWKSIIFRQHSVQECTKWKEGEVTRFSFGKMIGLEEVVL